jgi:hypothetical protein
MGYLYYVIYTVVVTHLYLEARGPLGASVLLLKCNTNPLQDASGSRLKFVKAV